PLLRPGGAPARAGPAPGPGRRRHPAPRAHLVRVDPRPGQAVVVVGDVHGQLLVVFFLLRAARFPSEDRYFVFIGDAPLWSGELPCGPRRFPSPDPRPPPRPAAPWT
uniref:Uncharacterized protein n=1 Tax=Zea mays TaxID=4577 RepID=A0A804LRD8_MAIZE